MDSCYTYFGVIYRDNNFDVEKFKERLNLNPWQDFFNTKQQIK